MEKQYELIHIADNTESDVIISIKMIDARVRGMAEQIGKDYTNQDLVVICVLASGLVFVADLMRAIPRPLEVGFMRATSYAKGKKVPVIVEDFLPDRVEVGGRDILIVDAICESGDTLVEVRSHLLKKDKPPRSIKTCVFALKRQDAIDPQINYCGFTIPNCMVYGYGINHMGLWRNEPNLKRIKEGMAIFTEAWPAESSVIHPTVGRVQPMDEGIEIIDRLLGRLLGEWTRLKDQARRT